MKRKCNGSMLKKSSLSDGLGIKSKAMDKKEAITAEKKEACEKEACEKGAMLEGAVEAE